MAVICCYIGTLKLSGLQRLIIFHGSVNCLDSAEQFCSRWYQLCLSFSYILLGTQWRLNGISKTASCLCLASQQQGCLEQGEAQYMAPCHSVTLKHG